MSSHVIFLQCISCYSFPFFLLRRRNFWLLESWLQYHLLTWAGARLQQPAPLPATNSLTLSLERKRPETIQSRILLWASSSYKMAWTSGQCYKTFFCPKYLKNLDFPIFVGISTKSRNSCKAEGGLLYNCLDPSFAPFFLHRSQKCKITDSQIK